MTMIVGSLGVLSLMAACSGTSTGTGTGTGTGKGLFGTGSSTSSSGSAVPTSCASAADDSACGTCLKTSCCSQTTACGNDQNCVDAFNCADACTSNDCVTQCENTYASAQTEINNLVSCANDSCATACNGDNSSSSSSSSTSGASGTVDSGFPPTFTGCLQNTPQDPSLCGGNASLIVVDCPDGNPSTVKCTPSPMGVGGIYCCTSVD